MLLNNQLENNSNNNNLHRNNKTVKFIKLSQYLHKHHRLICNQKQQLKTINPKTIIATNYKQQIVKNNKMANKGLTTSCLNIIQGDPIGLRLRMQLISVSLSVIVVLMLTLFLSTSTNINSNSNGVECLSLVETTANNAGNVNNVGGGIGGGGSANANQRGQNRCPAGWLWFNNKCWVTTQSRRSFVHAIELCRKMYFNSTLPTIHSEEENEFLRNNIELHNSPIWLYSRHNHQYNRTRWLDKSPVNYTRWDNGQPSDKSSLVCIKTEESWYMKKADPVEGQTECVSFWEDAKWGTQVGCQVLLPVVCEMKLPPIKRGANETSTPAELITPYYAGASTSSSQFASSILLFSSILLTTIFISQSELIS